MAASRPTRRILVTGGAGYIGSHVCRALAAEGYLPVTYDNLSHGNQWAVRWGPLEKGDLGDGRRLAAVMRSYRPDAVIHLAGLIAAGDSVFDPEGFYKSNLTGTLVLLEAMRACGVQNLVFSSSAAVYGEPCTALIDEHHQQVPISPYGASKAMVERLLIDYAVAYEFRSVALRYFNAVGAAPEDGIGEAHRCETHLVPLILDVAAGHRPAIQIFGDNFPTPDGTCIRDYVHVCDLSDAHVLALAFLQGPSAANAFNLGSEVGVSVREVVDAVARVTGRPVPFRMHSRRAGDPAVLVADSTAARRQLGWRPAFDELDYQISSAWAWHRQLHNHSIPSAGQRATAMTRQTSLAGR